MGIKVIVIPNEAPIFHANLGKKPGHSFSALAQEVLSHYGKIISHETAHGVLLEAFRPRAKDPEVNRFATKLAGTTVYGRCILVGKGQNNFESLSKETLLAVFTLYKEVTGINVDIKEKRLTHKTAFSWFSAKAFRERAQELADDPEFKDLKQNKRFAMCVKYAREQWHNMTAEQKAPYEEMERENRKQVEEDKKATDASQPQPPQKPRSMYQFFCGEQPEQKNAWKTLSAEQKQKWSDAAQADKERHEREWQAFAQVCASKNLDPVVVASRQRKPAQKQVFITKAKAAELMVNQQAPSAESVPKVVKATKLPKPALEKKPRAPAAPKAAPKAAAAKPKPKAKPRTKAVQPDVVMQAPLIDAAA